MRISSGLLVGVMLAAVGGLPAVCGATPEDDDQRPPPARTAIAPRKPVSREPGRARSLEVTASLLWVGPTALGSRPATLTSNDATGSPYTWFEVSGREQGAPAADVRAIYNITRMVAVGGGVTLGRPGIAFTVANDAEGAFGFAGTGETATQMSVDATVVLYVPNLAFANRRARPFVEAGAGVFRQLHGQGGVTAGYYSADTGRLYYAGGGVKYFFRPRPGGAVKGLGLRFDARVYVRDGGFSFDGRSSQSAAAGAGLIVAF